MPFKSFVAGETLTASDVNTYLAKQAVIVATSGTRPSSPVDGMTVYETDTDKLLVYDGTNWLLPDNVAGGTIGYATATADQSGISSETDLTGLSVTVTVGAGRRIKVTGQGLMSSTVANDTALGLIKEGATQVGRFFRGEVPTAGGHLGTGCAILTPSAGSHTYKLTLQRASGTGTLISSATVGLPAFILVEDIGV